MYSLVRFCMNLYGPVRSGDTHSFLVQIWIFMTHWFNPHKTNVTLKRSKNPGIGIKLRLWYQGAAHSIKFPGSLVFALILFKNSLKLCDKTKLLTLFAPASNMPDNMKINILCKKISPMLCIKMGHG